MSAMPQAINPGKVQHIKLAALYLGSLSGDVILNHIFYEMGGHPKGTMGATTRDMAYDITQFGFGADQLHLGAQAGLHQRGTQLGGRVAAPDDDDGVHAADCGVCGGGHHA